MTPTTAASSSEASPLSSVPSDVEDPALEEELSKGSASTFAKPFDVHGQLTKLSSSNKRKLSESSFPGAVEALNARKKPSLSPPQDASQSPGIPSTIRLKLRMPTEEPVFKLSSSLTKVDLIKLLDDETALSSLTTAQLHRLLSMLPYDEEILQHDTDAARIASIRAAVHDNEAFTADVQQLQQDIKEKVYTTRWMQKARAAARSRAQGEFDDWKEEQLETFWGQKAKPE